MGTTTTTAGREIVGSAGVSSGSAGVSSGSAGSIGSGSTGAVNSGTTGVVGSGNTNTDSKALSGGIIAAIVLACIAFLICLFACCFFMKIKNGNKQEAEEYDIEAPVVIISRRESVHVAPVMEVAEERVVEYDTQFVRHVIGR